MANQLLDIAECTSPGQVRPLNEDCYGTADQMQLDADLIEQRGILAAVADGMGGHAAGEVASEMAIKALFEEYYMCPQPDPVEGLLAGIQAANQEIHTLACNDCDKNNMGTTLVAAIVKQNQLYIANVGDSRAYLVRGGAVNQITHDHSWVAEQVRARLMTQEQADSHIYRNVITRAVGTAPEIHIDLFQERLNSNDVILLCSDGLSNKVTSADIQAILSTAADAAAGVEQLVDLANERGGEDNITAVVIRMP